jgi:hypothetical protein
MADGLSNHDISKRLVIREGTVEVPVKQISHSRAPRESTTVGDERTRIRITLSAQAAVHLWQQLADDVPAGPGGAPMPSNIGRHLPAKRVQVAGSVTRQDPAWTPPATNRTRLGPTHCPHLPRRPCLAILGDPARSTGSPQPRMIAWAASASEANEHQLQQEARPVHPGLSSRRKRGLQAHGRGGDSNVFAVAKVSFA